MKHFLSLSVILLAIVAGGCFTSKPTYSYLLCPAENAAMRSKSNVIIGGVRLAGYLERQNLVCRTGRHCVDIYTDILWAQDFRGMVKETLESNLLLRRGEDTESKKFTAYVDFLSFEQDASAGRFNVSVVCVLRAGTEVRKRHFVYGYDNKNTSGDKLIELYDRALAELADKLCEAADE